MTTILTLARRMRLGHGVVLLSLAAAACGSGGGEGKGAAAAAVPVEQVREQVRKFAMGSGEKDEAGEQFFNWGEAAHPGMAELARDPSLTNDELDAMIMIVGVEAHTPALFDALRTRISTMPESDERTARLGILDGLQANAGVPRS